METMNGFEMLEAVCQDAELSRIPVVMCSGSAWESTKNGHVHLGPSVISRSRYASRIYDRSS
jgi:CheY-like chemotaxis protein